jgi:hypothetical protein
VEFRADFGGGAESDVKPGSEVRSASGAALCPSRKGAEGNQENRRKAMAATRPRYSKEEFAKRGEALFERDIRPAIQAADDGNFVAIDIETGTFEVDADEQAASDRLLARLPHAQVWLRRVGSRYARHFGGRGRPTGQ